jgi:hypothetical protein
MRWRSTRPGGQNVRPLDPSQVKFRSSGNDQATQWARSTPPKKEVSSAGV